MSLDTVPSCVSFRSFSMVLSLTVLNLPMFFCSMEKFLTISNPESQSLTFARLSSAALMYAVCAFCSLFSIS